MILLSELYSYNLEIPLTYYTFDLRSEERDSEFVMGLDNNISWEEVYEVNEIVSEEKGLEIHIQETVGIMQVTSNNNLSYAEKLRFLHFINHQLGGVFVSDCKCFRIHRYKLFWVSAESDKNKQGAFMLPPCSTIIYL